MAVERRVAGKAPAGLEAQLRLQNEAASRLHRFRKEHGALTLGGVETVPIVADNKISGFARIEDNPARTIIESFMVAANVAMAQFLRARQSFCLRRVVRTPKRWDRIQAIAAQLGTRLPAKPDPRAFDDFLAARKQADPDHFPELSLAVLKSMGPGEYVVEQPGQEHEGHFGLAVDDYTHSTAPNRRYADLVTQRLLKASITSAPAPLRRGGTDRHGRALHGTRVRRPACGTVHEKGGGRHPAQPQVGKLLTPSSPASHRRHLRAAADRSRRRPGRARREGLGYRPENTRSPRERGPQSRVY